MCGLMVRVCAGFLTAMRQEVTRAHKGWSLDSVMLHNDVTKFAREDINNPPPVSICSILGHNFKKKQLEGHSLERIPMKTASRRSSWLQHGSQVHVYKSSPPLDG